MTPNNTTLVEELLNKATDDMEMYQSLMIKNAQLFRLAKQQKQMYRLLNDIRLGRILPVIKESGNLADVSFS